MAIMPANVWTIYLITNTTNGKKYVGLTKRKLKTRWREHLADARNRPEGKPLRMAINKYGVNSFALEVIESDVADPGPVEKQMIEKYNSTVNGWGYNLTAGGEINIALHMPPAAVEHARSMNRGIYKICRNDKWEIIDSIVEYSRAHGYDRFVIADKIRSNGRYYKNKYPELTGFKTVKHPPAHGRVFDKRQYKPSVTYQITDISGASWLAVGMKTASKDLNVSATRIYQAIKLGQHVGGCTVKRLNCADN